MDTDELYRLMTQVYSWNALARDDYFIDYQNLYTHLGVMSIRTLFVTCADAFMKAGENDRALEMVDKCCEVMQHYPIESVSAGFSANDYMVVSLVEDYYKLGQSDKARALAARLGADLLESAKFYIEYYEWAKDEFELVGQYIYFLAEVMKDGGDNEMAKKMTDTLVALVDEASDSADAS